MASVRDRGTNLLDVPKRSARTRALKVAQDLSEHLIDARRSNRSWGENCFYAARREENMGDSGRIYSG